MNTYRFTYHTQCGKTNVVVQTGDTLAEAQNKAARHIENKHSEMILTKTEVKTPVDWRPI